MRNRRARLISEFKKHPRRRCLSPLLKKAFGSEAVVRQPNRRKLRPVTFQARSEALFGRLIGAADCPGSVHDERWPAGSLQGRKDIKLHWQYSTARGSHSRNLDESAREQLAHCKFPNDSQRSAIRHPYLRLG